MNKARTLILKGNGTQDDFIEVHSVFNQSVDGDNYQKINNNDWFFTIEN